MYEIFEKLLKEKNVKVADITRATGIASSTFTDWKKGRYTPKQDKLQKIADYFGVTIDYLMNGEEKEWTPALTEKDEKDLDKKVENLLNAVDSDAGKLAAKAKYTPKKYKK